MSSWTFDFSNNFTFQRLSVEHFSDHSKRSISTETASKASKPLLYCKAFVWRILFSSSYCFHHRERWYRIKWGDSPPTTLYSNPDSAVALNGFQRTNRVMHALTLIALGCFLLRSGRNNEILHHLQTFHQWVLNCGPHNYEASNESLASEAIKPIDTYSCDTIPANIIGGSKCIAKAIDYDWERDVNGLNIQALSGNVVARLLNESK